MVIDPHPDSSYWQWLQRTAPINDRLKWCHRTDAFALRDIVKSGSLSPRMCEVFKEALTYLFYGRPAYRGLESQQMRLMANAPVVLIFRNSIERAGVRIYPFDSGAFESRYGAWRHRQMTLSGFTMPCGHDAAERHLSAFFGNRENYLAMQPSRPTEPYGGEFEVETVAEMLVDTSAEHADDRRLAVELQLKRSLSFSSVDTAAVIVPESVTGAKWFTSWQTGLGTGVTVKTYASRALHTAGHYQAKFEELCAELV